MKVRQRTERHGRPHLPVLSCEDGFSQRRINRYGFASPRPDAQVMVDTGEMTPLYRVESGQPLGQVTGIMPVSEQRRDYP